MASPLPPAAIRLAFAAVFALAAAGFGWQALGHAATPVDPPAAAVADYGDQKVVYHLTEDGGWFGRRHKRWLANMENHLAASAGRVDIAAVMNGDGLDLLIAAKADAALAARIDALKGRGVRFLVCRNTLAGRRLDAGRDLYGVAAQDVVGAGVAEIVRLERLGYAYLRP